MDPFDALADDARRDPELRKWFGEGRDWLRDVLLKTGYVLEPASTTAFDRWVDGGKVFYGEDGKYREHFNRLFDGAGEFVKGVGEDPGNTKFASNWAKLTRDLLFAEGEGGGLTFKKDLWTDIRKVVVPMLVEKVIYLCLFDNVAPKRFSYRLDTFLSLALNTPTTLLTWSSRT